jgi:hypothetical protein
MSLELAREIIKENRIISREDIQIIIENDIIVPDVKPDIERILFADGEAFVLNTEIDGEDILLKGVIQHKILYVKDRSEQNMHALNMCIDFEHVVKNSSIDEDMDVKAKCHIEHIESRIVNGRKINVRTILRIKTKTTKEKEHHFVSDIEDREDVQILRDSVNIRKHLGSSKDIYGIKESFEVPKGDPLILEILRNDVKLTNLDYKAADNKVVLKGDVNIQTLYLGDDKDSSINLIEHEATFNQTFDLLGAEESADIWADCNIQGYSFEPQEDEDGELRFIKGEIQIATEILGNISKEIEIISDTYGLESEFNIERTKISTEFLVDENRDQSAIKEPLTAKEEYPEIVEILGIFSRPVLLEHKLEENKIFYKTSRPLFKKFINITPNFFLNKVS